MIARALRRLTWLVVVAILPIIPAPALGRQSGAPVYAGRTLDAVLRDLQSQGLKLVFSSELVRPTHKVDKEPTAKTPRKIAEEVLKPHALELKPGPGDTLLVVRAKRRSGDPSGESTEPPKATGTIRGTVVDARTGTPLPGVSVGLPGAPSKVLTDESGAFVLAGVPAEPQMLFVTMVGYALARPTVDVQPNATSEIKVPLADGTGSYTETVTVTSDRFRGPVTAVPAQQVLTSADLQDLRGLMADDPFRAVQALPGVATGDDYRSEFSVRGSDYRHMNVSADGVTTRWLVHAVRGRGDSGSVGLINGDVLDRATLVSGAAPQLAPLRTGGGVDFDIREGSRAEPSAKLAVSASGASFVADGPIGSSHRGAWLVSGRQSYIQWLLKQLGFEGTRFGFTDTQSKFVFDVTPRQQLQVTFIAGRSKLEETEDNPGPNSIARGISRVGLLTAAWRSTFDRGVLTQRVSGVRETFENFGDFGQPLGEGTGSEIAYALRYARTFGSHVTAELGGDVRELRESQVAREFGFTGPAHPVERSSESFGGSTTIAATSARVQWTSASGAMVDGGVRIAHTSLGDDTTAGPWMLFSMPLGSQLTVRAGASEVGQFPDLDQLTGLSGHDDIQPEHARHLEIGVEGRIGAGSRWQATFYDRQERDMLRLENGETRIVGDQFVPRSLAPHWQNRMRGSARGLELLVQRRAVRGMTGWVGYAYGKARYDDTLTGESFWADFDQRHTFNAYGQYRVSAKATISARLRIGSNFPIAGYFTRQGDRLFLSEMKNDVRLPLYSRLDLRANRAFNYTKRRLTLFVEVVNALGRTNYGPADGTIRQNLREGVDFVEKLFPILPSAGFLFEF